MAASSPRPRAAAPDDLATLIYTSGTTGSPKAIELTHEALLRGWRSLQTAWQLEPGGRVISDGSSAHISDRCTAHYGSMVLGLTVTCAGGAHAAVGLLPEVRPSLLFAVPPTWAAVRASIEALAAGGGDDRRRAFDHAVGLARHALALERRGVPMTDEMRAEWQRVDAEVIAPVRERSGLAATLCLVGGAPCPLELIEFFLALGIRFGEMYGMSEVVTHVTFDPRDPVRPGTVGRPLPGVELRVDAPADSEPGIGEILVRGDALMRGYRNRPDDTAQALDADGWLHTGDLGVLDSDGYLMLAGRKGELIINSNGHNMSPTVIEAALQAETPMLAQVCVFGDGRPYNVALMTLSGGAVDDQAREAVADAVARANARLSVPERIERYTLLDHTWVPGTDELTPTMKPRRGAIAERYHEQIESLYR